MSSSNHSSPNKCPRRLTCDNHHEQQNDNVKKNLVTNSSSFGRDRPLTRDTSRSSMSSMENSHARSSFPLPSPPSAARDLCKADATSAYTVTDDQQDETLMEKLESNVTCPYKTSPMLPTIISSSSSSSSVNDKKQIFDKEIKQRPSHSSLSTSKPPIKQSPLSAVECKQSRHKTNVFTSSSHSMIDAGCGEHLLSRIPALRCFRLNKQTHAHKSKKITHRSSTPPPPLVVR
jgi:ribosomal protein S27E